MKTIVGQVQALAFGANRQTASHEETRASSEEISTMTARSAASAA